MAKLNLYPCISKDAAGVVTVTAFIDLLTGTTYTPADVAAMGTCPLYDTERDEVCYSLDGGVTVLPGGTYVAVYTVDPDTGLPELVPVEEQILDNSGKDVTATATVETCPSLPDSEVREVCVDTNSDGISDQKGLQHVSYSIDPLTGDTVTSAVLTELDATTVLVGDVVDCPETFFGTPIEVCV